MKRRLTMLAACGFALMVGFGCAQQAEPVGEEPAVEAEAPAEDAAQAAVADGAEADGESDPAAAGEAEADENEADEAEAEEEKPASTPEQTCVELASAAEQGDTETFSANVTDAALEAMSQDNKLAKGIMKIIAKASCGEATMSEDGERATVNATVGKETRDIPFALVDGAWKFDGAAYMEHYPVGKKRGRNRKRGRRRR